MGMSRRAKRGIAIFSKIQLSPSRFRYLLSEKTRIELEGQVKEILNGPKSDARITVESTEPAITVVRTGRETVTGSPNVAPDAEPTGQVQHDVHDVHANDASGAPGVTEGVKSDQSTLGPDVSKRDE